jgi:hypothetical protein
MKKLRPYFLIFLGIAYLKYPSLSSAQTPILKTGTSFTTTELPYTTGQHTWPFEGGQLIMNSARYTNQTSWDVRNYTFYFKTKDEFYLVPIQKSGKTKSHEGVNFSTQNMGEDLVSDCLVISKGKKIFLLTGIQPWGIETATQEKNDISIELYELKFSEEDIPYQFLFKNKKVQKNAPRISIDKALKKEALAIWKDM